MRGETLIKYFSCLQRIFHEIKVKCLWSHVVNSSDHTTGVKLCDVICWLADHKHRPIFLAIETYTCMQFHTHDHEIRRYLVNLGGCVFVEIKLHLITPVHPLNK
jgi:hypothetical protein